MAWDLAAESEPDGGGDQSRLLRHINSKTNTKVAKGGMGKEEEEEAGSRGGGRATLLFLLLCCCVLVKEHKNIFLRIR